MMGFDQFWVVLVALALLLAVGEWRYRRARRRRAERLAGDPLFELEQKIEEQDKLVSILASQKAREGVFASEELLAEFDRQHAELRRMQAEYAAQSAARDASGSE